MSFSHAVRFRARSSAREGRVNDDSTPATKPPIPLLAAVDVAHALLITYGAPGPELDARAGVAVGAAAVTFALTPSDVALGVLGGTPLPMAPVLP